MPVFLWQKIQESFHKMSEWFLIDFLRQEKLFVIRKRKLKMQLALS